MPKISNKKKFLQLYEKNAFDDLLISELFGKNDDTQKEKEDAILEELTLTMIIAEHSRYLTLFLHHSVPKANNFLIDVLPYLDDDRFKQIVRVNRTNFNVILDLIKEDELFNGPRSCQQFSLEKQLPSLLYRLGSSGEGATVAKIANFFGIGDGGTIQNITARVFKAILKLKNEYMYWPSASERNKIVAEALHELPHCIGYVDGTEIKLAEKPTEDSEAYFSRKHVYSLKVQAVCDYKLRIRHMVLGYPGSVHDARIYNNCDLPKEQEFFTGAEWLAGDSAYKLIGTVITPFRDNSAEMTLDQRKTFNKHFSKYRIRIEHCFGLLKERFNSLKELKIQVKNDFSIKLACRWILVSAILHKIVTEQTETKDICEVPDEPFSTDENDNQEPVNDNSSSTVAGRIKRLALLEIIEEQQNSNK